MGARKDRKIGVERICRTFYLSLRDVNIKIAAVARHQSGYCYVSSLVNDRESEI